VLPLIATSAALANSLISKPQQSCSALKQQQASDWHGYRPGTAIRGSGERDSCRRDRPEGPPVPEVRAASRPKAPIPLQARRTAHVVSAAALTGLRHPGRDGYPLRLSPAGDQASSAGAEVSRFSCGRLVLDVIRRRVRGTGRRRAWPAGSRPTARCRPGSARHGRFSVSLSVRTVIVSAVLPAVRQISLQQQLCCSSVLVRRHAGIRGWCALGHLGARPEDSVKDLNLSMALAVTRRCGWRLGLRWPSGRVRTAARWL
jgi:hypothetical protein